MLFFASRAALASRSRCTICSAPFHAAKCSGVSPREPQPKPQAELDGTNDFEKSFEKIWAPQKSKFWKMWPHQWLPTRLSVVLRCLEVIELVEKALSGMLAAKHPPPLNPSKVAPGFHTFSIMKCMKAYPHPKTTILKMYEMKGATLDSLGEMYGPYSPGPFWGPCKNV